MTWTREQILKLAEECERIAAPNKMLLELAREACLAKVTNDSPEKERLAFDDFTRFVDCGAWLDAAMQLLPAGTYWLLAAGKDKPEEPLYGAQLRRGIFTSGDVTGQGENEHAPSLALAGAALRARAATLTDAT